MPSSASARVRDRGRFAAVAAMTATGDPPLWSFARPGGGSGAGPVRGGAVSDVSPASVAAANGSVDGGGGNSIGGGTSVAGCAFQLPPPTRRRSSTPQDTSSQGQKM
jgi:hypothetical protein